MASKSHHADDDERVADPAADCRECRPAEGGTRQARRVLFFVCAGSSTVVSRTLERIQARPPCGVGVEVSRPEDAREALQLARGNFSGESDRVVVVIDFDDPGGHACLDAAKTLALSHPVLAFFATEQGGEAQLAFVRTVEDGGRASVGRFETCHLGKGEECVLRSVRAHLLNECQV